MPERKSAGAAGYDLVACENANIPPSMRALVDTGIAIAVPEGTYGRIAPRSGMAVRGISVGAGVIDADYRGSVKVLLFNHSSAETLVVHKGDRIAQLVLEVILTPDVNVIAEGEQLPDAERGVAGFGSTGV